MSTLQPPRKTLLDSLGRDTIVKNLFCRRDVLGNEASVEHHFVVPLVEALGYREGDVRTKASIDELLVAKGRKKLRVRPDYVLVAYGGPRVVLDAKATGERLEDHIDQVAGYAAALNQQTKGDSPVRYYVLTNGLQTLVFDWDETEPRLSLSFDDFAQEAPKWAELQVLLGRKAMKPTTDGHVSKPKADATMTLVQPDMEAVKRLFERCHNIIWKAEKQSPGAAFFEFVKLMFVKLSEDRRLHSDPKIASKLEEGEAIPASEVRFSVRWVEGLQDTHPDPIGHLLFGNLLTELEKQVVKKQKKRIFAKSERITLKASTTLRVVQELESVDLWGIDEDLNGRLFETFLGATMRGQALGQYFTPRTIVKFATSLAPLEASSNHVTRVLDACCGTGGFLIEALAVLRKQVDSNGSLSSKEKEDLHNLIANESLFGMDAGKNPVVAQIARINMYLHGDGGSRIYAVDSLDKQVRPQATASSDQEEIDNVEELAELLKGGLDFDVVLTNPPFSMSYAQKNPDEAEVLVDYEMAKVEGTSKIRSSLISPAMFLERYHDVLTPGGQLITIMDDSILSGSKHEHVREWMRRHFLIRAVISLPGDAFQRSGARTKTSVMILEKRKSTTDPQPAAFMYEAVAMGLDDLPTRTPPSVRKAAFEAARTEADEIRKEYRRFRTGNKTYAVPAEKLADRLDVKSLVNWGDEARARWREKGHTVVRLRDIVDEVDSSFSPKEADEDEFTFLQVSYRGAPSEGETKMANEISYSTLKRAHAGDLVVSHINALHGSVAVMAEDLTHCVMSSEYTVLRLKDECDIDPAYIWAVLRSYETRARLVSESSGGGRHRIHWDDLKDVPIPVPPEPASTKAFGEEIRRRQEQAKKALAGLDSQVEALQEDLALASDGARHRFAAAKPPR